MKEMWHRSAYVTKTDAPAGCITKMKLL